MKGIRLNRYLMYDFRDEIDKYGLTLLEYSSINTSRINIHLQMEGLKGKYLLNYNSLHENVMMQLTDYMKAKIARNG